jgi:hypothetical protein
VDDGLLVCHCGFLGIDFFFFLRSKFSELVDVGVMVAMMSVDTGGELS